MRTTTFRGLLAWVGSCCAACGGTTASPSRETVVASGGAGGTAGPIVSGNRGGQAERGGGGSGGFTYDLSMAGHPGCEGDVCYSGHIGFGSIGPSCGGPPLFRTCTPLTPDGIDCVGLGEPCPGEAVDAGSARVDAGVTRAADSGATTVADAGADGG